VNVPGVGVIVQRAGHIFATSGTADDLSGQQLYFYSELKVAVEIAHQAGLRVAVHSYGKDAIADALKAGVDSIEHPVGFDQCVAPSGLQRKKLSTFPPLTTIAIMPTTEMNTVMTKAQGASCGLLFKATLNPCGSRTRQASRLPLDLTR